MTRSDGTLNASWPAVSGATHYHVTYTVNGSGSWHLGALNHPSASIAISGVDNSKSYVVAARAGNDGGWSGWRNSPAAGPYVPPAPERPTGLTATPGDGSVTLAWNDPANSSITGYEYQMRAAPPAPGWSAWTAISGNVTTATVTGLTNGTEYRFKLRAVNASGAGKPAGPPWYVAATPKPLTAPTGLSVTPGAGYLDIAWDAVSEATGYDVRAKAEGASDWHDVASNIAETSYTYTTSATMDYIGVRARNTGGVSAWSDVSRMPSDDLLNVATGLSSGGASAQSVQGQSQLASPTWGTITRAYDITLYSSIIDLNWTTVNSATGYNIVCSGGGWYWYACGWDDDGTVKYPSVPSAESQPVTVSHYRHGSESRLTPGDHTLAGHRSYMLSIRAVNANPAQASAWVNTPLISPILPVLTNFTHTRADERVTLSWKPNLWTTGYDVYCATYTSGGTYNPSYTKCATLTGQDDTAASHSVTITKSGGTHNWSSLDNTSILDIKIDSTTTWSTATWLAPLIHPDYKLTVSNIGVQTATLTIANYSGDWYYQANTGQDATCKGPVSGASKDISRLSANTSYDYTAYSDSACTTVNELAAAASFTTLSSVSNVGSTKAGESSISLEDMQAVAFTTGPSDNGYVLKSVTIPMKNKGGTQGLTVELYPDADPSSTYSHDSAPATDGRELATLSGTAPTSVSNEWTNTTFTCSGSGCKLSKDSTYYVIASSNEAPPAYAWAYATTEDEDALPSGNGWSVGYSHYKETNRSWKSWATADAGDWNIAKFVFAPAPTLSASNLTGTGATLTITNHNDAWYYQATTAPHDTCQGPVNGASTTLSGLSAGTAYTYTAYSDSGCTSGNELTAQKAFTTTTNSTPSTPSVSNLSSTKAGGSGKINKTISQAVAFTTGSNSNGYTLTSVTVPLRNIRGTQGTLGALLYEMAGTGDYSSSSEPARNALANADFSGTAPTSSAWTDTTFTCSGDDCDLDADTTYFFALGSNANLPGYGWAYTKTENEVALPADNGWGIGYGHFNSGSWKSHGDWSLAKFDFTNAP